MNKKQAIAAIKARIEGEWDNPQLLKIGALNTDPLKDIQVILNIARPIDEPVKITITSPNIECRLYVVYHNNDLKVIESNGQVVYIPFEDLAEIKTAMENKAP